MRVDLHLDANPYVSVCVGKFIYFLHETQLIVCASNKFRLNTLSQLSMWAARTKSLVSKIINRNGPCDDCWNEMWMIDRSIAMRWASIQLMAISIIAIIEIVNYANDFEVNEFSSRSWSKLKPDKIEFPDSNYEFIHLIWTDVLLSLWTLFRSRFNSLSRLIEWNQFEMDTGESEIGRTLPVYAVKWFLKIHFISPGSVQECTRPQWCLLLSFKMPPN